MKLSFLALLILFQIGNAHSQINIEIIDPNGEVSVTSNDTAHVCFEISPDTTKLLIQDDYGKAYYDVGKVEPIQEECNGVLLAGSRIFILNDKSGLIFIKLWKGINTAAFEYEDGSIVINSGKGITYFL